MKYVAPKRVLREDLPDAPAGEWLDTVLQSLSGANEQTAQAFAKGLTHAENTTSGYETYRLTHGTPVTITNPLKVRPTGIHAVRTLGVPGTTRPRPPVIDWEFVPGTDPMAGDQIKITPWYDNSGESTGYAGEQQRGFIDFNNAIGSITTNVAKTVTSISLTAGTWDISAVALLYGSLTGTRFSAGISTSTNTLPAAATEQGDNLVDTPTVSSAAANQSLCIPQYRVTPSSTTTYYLVSRVVFTVGTPTFGGRISAVRALPYLTGRQADVVLFFHGG